jgi:hypothetical protein
MYPAVVLCLAILMAANPDPAESPPAVSAQTRAEYETLKASARSDAEAQLALALWCEARGLAAERAAHLAKAVLRDPDNTRARGLLGFVSHKGRWLAAEAVGPAVMSDPTRAAALAEYNARRDALDALTALEKQKLQRREDLADELPAHGNDLLTVQAFRTQVRRDAALQAYRTASDQKLAWEREKLGEWCQSAGLATEAIAEFSSAVLLDSSITLAWKGLGFVDYEGRWLAPDAAAAEKAEAAAQRSADRQWEPLLRKWKQWLGDKKHAQEAEAQLAQVNDPRAVAAVIRVFGPEPALHVRAVQILEGLDGPKASLALAHVALYSPSDRARSNATVILRRRPEREYAQSLVEMVEAPKTYRVAPVTGPGSIGMLLVDSPRFTLLRSYEAPPVANLRGAPQYVGYDINGLPVIIRHADQGRIMRELQRGDQHELRAIEVQTAELIQAANIKAAAAQQWLASDVRDLEQSNADARLTNRRVAFALKTALDAPDIEPDDPGAWRTWWYDRTGYSYTPPRKVRVEQVQSNLPAPTIMSCFAAGTLVHTLDGPRPIESVRAGDQVLSQSITSGALAYQVVLTVFRNPPAQTVKLTMDDGEVVLPSIYHRFWLAGKGWALARDLKAGDGLRCRTGRVTVKSAEPGDVVPVFNLSVASDKTYFVGQRDYLVHDNTPPEPGAIKPFDAVPALAAAALVSGP